MVIDREALVRQEGRLAIGLFPSFFYAKDRSTGALTGWGVEMARELAQRLGVELELVERASPPDVVAALRAGACDAAFLGISVERATEVEFTPAWVQAEFTFLVQAGSDVQRIADADRTGMRIAVVRNHAMDAALRGQVERARRVYADTPEDAFALLRSGQADVLAGIRPGLVAFAGRLPDARVLADRYGANVIGMAVAKGETAWLATVSAFVTESKASGAARAAAVRVGAVGLEVVS